MNITKQQIQLLFLILGTPGLSLAMLLALPVRPISTAHAREQRLVIRDEAFDPADWLVTAETTNGASFTAQPLSSGGNPGAYWAMQSVLPPPSSPNGHHSERGRALSSLPAGQL